MTSKHFKSNISSQDDALGQVCSNNPILGISLDFSQVYNRSWAHLSGCAEAESLILEVKEKAVRFVGMFLELSLFLLKRSTAADFQVSYI